MTLSVLAILGGIALLVWGSDQFICGASALARNFGISPLIVGLTVVGMGTSAPEILVSATAAWQGSPALSVGNAVGSNIANIGLVIGICALVVPLKVSSLVLRREFVLMFAVVLLAGGLLLDQGLSRTDGTILMVALVVVIAVMTSFALTAPRSDPLQREFDLEIPEGMSNTAALLRFTLGLVVLLLSAQTIVWGAVNVARALGVSDLVIGLTIIAVGTSLPELAASITSAVRNEHDIAIGNVIGSNIFNLLPVLAMPGLIAPGTYPAELLYRDYLTMLIMTVGFFLVAFKFRGPGVIRRWEGSLCILAFVTYQIVLYNSIT